MARKNFIQNAIKRPGALHEALGVPKGQKIPPELMAAAAKRKGQVGQEARFAKNVLSKVRRKKKG